MLRNFSHYANLVFNCQRGLAKKSTHFALGVLFSKSRMDLSPEHNGVGFASIAAKDLRVNVRQALVMQILAHSAALRSIHNRRLLLGRQNQRLLAPGGRCCW